MAVKKTRILKYEWPTFVKDFNRQNQFRKATLSLGKKSVIGEPGLPLVGLCYNEDRRRMEFYFGGMDPKNPAHLAHRVEVPRAIYLIRDTEACNPVRGVQIKGAPEEDMAYVIFLDEEPAKCEWTAMLAYNLYKMRGTIHGEDQKDWYEAERLIEEVATPFID